MATAQAVRVKPELREEVTAQHALSITQNLLRASIMEIAFLRNLFDDEIFRDAKFGGTKVRTSAGFTRAARV